MKDKIKAKMIFNHCLKLLMLFSLFKKYSPDLKFSNCETAKFFECVALLISEHIYTLTINCNIVIALINP